MNLVVSRIERKTGWQIIWVEFQWQLTGYRGQGEDNINMIIETMTKRRVLQ